MAPSRGLRAPGPARARRERTGASGARPAGGPRRTGAGRSPGSGASASHSSRAAAAAGAGSPWPGRAPPPQRRGPLLCTPRRAPLPAAPLGIARAGAGRSRVQDLLLAGSAPAAAATETRARVRARRPRFKASRRSGVRQGAPGHPLHLRIALGLSARPAHPAGMQCSQGPHLNWDLGAHLSEAWGELGHPILLPGDSKYVPPIGRFVQRSTHGVPLSLWEH